MSQEPDVWSVVGVMAYAAYGFSQIAVGPNTLPCLRGGITKQHTQKSQISVSLMISNHTSLLECPVGIPSSNHLCVSPGSQECKYEEDVCCCNKCTSTFSVTCSPDAVTGAGVWQGAWDINTICPAGGCGDQGCYLLEMKTISSHLFLY